jgi:hypothetical protein
MTIGGYRCHYVSEAEENTEAEIRDHSAFRTGFLTTDPWGTKRKGGG